MNRGTTKFLSTYIKTLGYPVHDSRRKNTANLPRLVVCTSCLLWIFIQFIVISMQNRDNFYDFVFPLGYSTVIAYFLSGLAAFIFRLEQVKALLQHVDRNIYTYPDESDIAPRYDWITGERNMVIVFWCIFWYNSCASVADASLPFIQLAMQGRVEVLIYPGWIPWSIEGVLPFIGTYFMHFCILLACTSICNLTCIYTLFVTFEYQRQCKRLNAALGSIEQRTRTFTLNTLNIADPQLIDDGDDDACCLRREYRQRYQTKFRENVVSCIRHHQMLIKVFNLFESWWEIVFSTLLATSIINFALSFYCLMETTALQEIISLCTLIWVSVCGLLLYSYVGEEFLELNEQIRNTIFYEIEWYQQSLDIQRLLVCFHTLIVRKSFRLSGLSIFQASYQTFAYICRSSYSYINMLKASLD